MSFAERTLFMKTLIIEFIALLVLALVVETSAQSVTQTFQLRNGWNSIWLEVEPTNAEIASVFAGLPLASVWTFVPQLSTVEFIQDQSEDLFNQPGWLPHFPPQRPEAFLTKLYRVNALRAYLVKLTNGPHTLTVTGRPVVREVRWVPDSFNLRGFPVNPSMLPTFNTFFGPSAAHAGQRIYQLRDDGQWTLVAPGDLMKHGEAYWVFCRGASKFPGPLGIEVDFGDGLHYGSVLTELVPRVINHASTGATVCWSDLLNGVNNPLYYQVFASNRLSWVRLPAPYCFTMDAGEERDVRLTMRRMDFPGTNFVSILEVKDAIGTRYLVPVTAEKLLAARTSLTSAAGAGNPFAGLWVGSASVSNVNEVNLSQPTQLTPTRSSFDLRLLIHVDTNGQARLLKEVIQMWQNGTTTNDAAGRAVTDKPGRFVLLTDDSLIPQFRGASLRDGTPVGRRLSTASFDFDGGATNMSGGFAINATNRCTIVLEPNFSTNPFKHRFHPDHDNLDASYTSYREEAYRITRSIELRYHPADPAGPANASLDYGYNVLGGVYHESIAGLHRTNIVAEGTFRLTRVSNTPVLNQ
jgi:hypothetical protein